MKTLSIKEFAQANNIVRYSLQIRENANGYLFVTFTTANREGTNIYFSRAMSEKLSVGDDTRAALKEHGCSIVETTNADGEIRLKLCGNSEHGNIEDLF
jgi:hypothetical protein